MKKTPDGTGRPEKSAVDWAEMNRRLDAARQGLAHTGGSSPEERRAVLNARARALARELVRTEPARGMLSVIEFRLASETYAIEAEFVREVYPLRDIVRLPGTPDFILGIVNVRGQILSVVDLKKFFGLPEKGLGDLNKLIILQDSRLTFGVLADAIIGARPISSEGAQASLPTLSGVGADYLKGVTAEGVILLDAKKILKDERMVVQDTAYAAGTQ